MSAIEFKKETSDSPVCSSEGTSALDSASQTKTLSGKKLSKKHGRKKNSRTAALRHNTTETNIRIIDLMLRLSIIRILTANLLQFLTNLLQKNLTISQQLSTTSNLRC